MKIYFTKITADHWTAKNNLYKDAHKLAHDMDRRIMPEADLPSFKKEFQDCVDFLNLKYKRCKPLRFSINESPMNDGDIYVYCDGVFQMGIFLAKSNE